jgi:hypothetical protein
MVQDKIRALEAKVSHLEDKLRRLVILLNHNEHPFIHLAVEEDWTEEQVGKIQALMDR